MAELNPTLVILLSVIFVLGIIFWMERKKSKKMKEKMEGVHFFGEKVTTQDFFSFCNTCAAYLLIDEKKTLDLKNFVPEDKLKSKKGKESLRMIEQTINLFPIISCTWLKDAIFIVDEAKTVEKIENYQKNTQTDDYIVPLFDVGLISRNPKIFNVSTKYQQAKTAETVLTTRGIGDQFEAHGDIVKGLETLAEDEDNYETPDILYSERNIQSIQ